jgi:ABC-2 type transport system permease protein
MSRMRAVALVARRELVERARSRAFLLSTVLTLVIVVFAIGAPRLFGNEKPARVGLAGSTPEGVSAALEAQAAGSGQRIEVERYTTTSQGEAALAAGTVDVLVADGREIVFKSERDEQLQGICSGALQRVDVGRRATALGLDPAATDTLLAPADVKTRSLEPVAEDRDARRFAAMIVVVLLFVAINMYGTFVLTGVVEEKSSRVVEVLLARVRPRDLLAGKILGIGLLGLAQILLFGATAAVALSALRDTALPGVGPGLVAWLVLWFVLGYALYSMAYGSFGALASRMEDAQSAAGPLTIVLLVSYFATFSAITGKQGGVGRTVVSLLPVTAPMAMPMRLASGGIAPWEVALAIPLMLASIWALARFAGRVYTGAALRVGAKVKLGDAWRAGAS